MNVKFTADMENKLDDIAEGKEKWQEILKNFYTELSKYIEKYKKIVDADENKVIESDMPCPCGGGYMIMKNGRFGRYLACSNEGCKQNISLRGIEIPMEEIKAGKIHVKDIVEQKIAEKKGKPTDVLADNGSPMLLKFGRFGSYLESENYSSDNIRTPLPSEIKKALALNEIPEENGVVKLNLRLQAIKSEEKAILDKAGVCEKCGRPFRIGKGRWGRYLACTGYPECKNIKTLDKDGNIVEKKEKEETKSTTKKTKK